VTAHALSVGAMMEQDGSVRAIGRGLAVLRAINQHGSLNMMAIAKATMLPYPTTCRIVDTLIEEGMIEREPGRKFYRPTPLVRSLSHGYRPEDDLAAAARPAISGLTRSILWPLTVCSRVGSTMMIRESSHKISPKTLNIYYPGHTFPMLGGSAGITYLASCSADEREAVLKSLEQSGELGGAYTRSVLTNTFEDVRRQGFSVYERCHNNANPGKTSSLSAPIMVDGSCEGTVTVVFFASAMTMAEGIERYAEPVCTIAGVIAGNLTPSGGDHAPAIVATRDRPSTKAMGTDSRIASALPVH
jgi:IclR family mhp operon transcriptional activator